MSLSVAPETHLRAIVATDRRTATLAVCSVKLSRAAWRTLTPKLQPLGIQRHQYCAGDIVVTSTLWFRGQVLIPAVLCLALIASPATSQTKPNLLGELLGSSFRFESASYPEMYLYHTNMENWVGSQNDSWVPFKGKAFEAHTVFTVVPGLSGKGISFRSKNWPNRYIVHRNWKCVLQKIQPNDPQWRKDASFIPREAQGKFKGKNVYAFQSVSYPEKYMRHSGWRVGVHQLGYDVSFEGDSAWKAKLVTPIETGGYWDLLQSGFSKYEIRNTEGVVIGKKTSMTQTDEQAYKKSAEASGSAFGTSIKAAFEASGKTSLTKFQSSTWQSSRELEETKTLDGKDGQYYWQWVLKATFGDGEVVEVRTPLYKQTSTEEKPSDPK